MIPVVCDRTRILVFDYNFFCARLLMSIHVMSNLSISITIKLQFDLDFSFVWFSTHTHEHTQSIHV